MLVNQLWPVTSESKNLLLGFLSDFYQSTNCICRINSGCAKTSLDQQKDDPFGVGVGLKALGVQ